MNLSYFLVNTLPKLAWCAIVDRHQSKCKIYHGNEVEVHDDFFAEGAWNEDFSSDGLTKATTLCGTAGCISQSVIRFFSSTDTLSPLFSISIKNNIFISNSPIFALSAAGLEPASLHPFYAYDFVRIFQSGLNCQSGNLVTNSKNPLKVHFNTILTIDSNNNLTTTKHTLDKEFNDYISYKRILDTNISQLFNNSKHSKRSVKYDSLSLISRGYDSLATACLAAQAGCKLAATFIDQKKSNPYKDSGKDLAIKLGMSCTEYDRWGYTDKVEAIDQDFALGTIAVNPATSMLSNILHQKLLVSGAFGHIAWEYPFTIIATNLIKPNVPRISAFSQLEYRLNLGYQIFAPSTIALRHNQNIASLSISEEMMPWSIGGDYDKPIPRRIAEESGIPRDAFGFKKMASGHAHFYTPSHFSKNGLRTYLHFLKAHLNELPLHKIIMTKFLVKLENYLYQLWFSKRKDITCSNPNRFRLTALDGKRHPIRWKFSFMFHWAFASLKSRYVIPESLEINQKTTQNNAS